MRRRLRVPAVLTALAVLGCAASGCAALRPVSAQQAGDGICTPVTAGDPRVTIGTTFVTATVDAELVGVELVEGDNLEVVGWRTRPLVGTLTGTASGFDTAAPEHAIPAGTERHVEVGYALIDPARPGRADAVRLAYRALGRDGLTGATGVEVTVVPADESCAAY
ncbi:hypothetical protein [Microbacterium sp. T2.11-28]|uniref:hypothetical protein n=1 Tax=Microbacterium sp. T2.11-28 TaxID=3041169 RepID=UPI00247757E8|nr:hypothetical protein [Microbacterium sp. T2.11-28]CAI9386821.1 hypothetical protein MICABA_00607 [Microbacterium sp. T2.11-28]